MMRSRLKTRGCHDTYVSAQFIADRPRSQCDEPPSLVARGKCATHHILKFDQHTSFPSTAECTSAVGRLVAWAYGCTVQHDPAPPLRARPALDRPPRT